MKKLLLIIAATFFSMTAIAFAAPVSNIYRSIVPEADNTYYIGTTTPSSLQYKGIYTKDLTVTGTCTGCGSSASYPFTPTTNYNVAVNSTSTPIWFTAGLMASSTSYFPGSGIWNSSGRVGIGTTTPDIAGTTLDTLVIGTASAINAGIVLDLGAAGTGAYGFAIDGTINSRISYSAASKAMSFLANSLTAQMTLVSSGNVGIGTTTPGALLSLGTAITTIKVAAYDGGGSQMYGMGVNSGQLTFGAGIAVSGTPQMVLTSGGLVGVGTTSPWGKLSVTNTGTGPSFVVEDATSPDSTPFIIDASGKVGIGTTTPQMKLDVWGTFRSHPTTNSNLEIQVPISLSDGVALRATNDAGSAFAGIEVLSSKFVINAAGGTGNVGIGTTSPGQKLSVAGDILGNNIIGSYFTSTSTTASTFAGAITSTATSRNTFPYASTTAISASGQFFGNAADFVTTPSYSWGGDTTTGIYRSTTSQVGIAGAGLQLANFKAGTTTLNIYATNGTLGEIRLGRVDSTVRYNTIKSMVGTVATDNFIDFNLHNLVAGVDYSSVNSILMLRGDGRVGISSSTPLAKLSVHANANDGAISRNLFTIASSTATATTTLFNIDNIGNVGIGTTTPGSLFSVSGDAYLSGFYNTSQTTGGYKMNGSVVLTASSTSGLTLGGIGAGSALSATTTLNGNTVFGFNAANVSTSTNQTTAIGYRALASLNDCRNAGTGGSGCLLTAVGYQALAANTTGYWNTALGANALAANTTGTQNVGLGAGALILNTTGSGNVAIGGTNTLSSNVSGSSNVAVGQQSLQLNTSSTNTGIGTYAGFYNTSGSVNTFIGSQAGMGAIGVTNDSNSVIDTNMLFLGYRAAKDRYGLASTSVMTNSAAIGANAVVGASNAIALGGLGSNAVRVGIGSSTPFAKLSLHAYNGETNINLFAIGSSTASATTTHFTVKNDGKVYAPNTTSSGSAQTGYWCYDADGQFVRTSTTCLVSASRFKERVGDLDVGLAELMKLRPVSYFLKDTMGDPNNADQQIGFIAEEAQAVDARLVTRNSEGQVQSFRYEQFTALLTKAIQEQQRQIENLKVGVVEIKRSVEEDWQNFFLLLLFAGLIFQQVQINKLRK